MSEGRSSLISKKPTQESNNLVHNNDHAIERLPCQQEKMPLENIEGKDQTEHDRLNNMTTDVEHWVFFSCHALKWEAFNPISKKWMHPPIISADTCFQLSDKESIAVGTELMVIGKDILGQAIYKYSLLTKSWSVGPTMKTPRCLFGSASLGKVAIFAGGVNETGKIIDTVESYDINTGAWETLPRLLKPRKMCSGVFIDGKFYVIGGTGRYDKNPLMCGEEYDFMNKKWSVIPSMSPGGGVGPMAPPLVAVVNNALYVNFQK